MNTTNCIKLIRNGIKFLTTIILKFSNHFPQPIQLPPLASRVTQETYRTLGNTGSLSSWANNPYKWHPNKLDQIDLKSKPCHSSENHNTINSYSSICLEKIENTLANSPEICVYDAGAPIVAGNYLVGVLGEVQGCGNETIAYFATDIGVFRNWIVETTDYNERRKIWSTIGNDRVENTF